MSGRLFTMMNYLVIKISVTDHVSLFQAARKYIYITKKIN